MEPIATYTERHFQVARVFSLFRDRVEVNARWLIGGRHRNIVKLESLTGAYKTMLIRNKYYRRGLWILAAGMVALSWPIYQHQMSSPLIHIGAALSIVGGVLVGLTFRKVPFVRFTRVDGSAGLDVGAAGPDRKRFEEFITQIQRQIKRR